MILKNTLLTLREATAKHESTDKEVAELQKLHDKEKADAEKEHEDLMVSWKNWKNRSNCT